MSTRFLDFYRREWPKTQTNLRALAVMNAMTMCVHQYEEYVDPGWFPGLVNIGIFKSDQPLNYPFNAHWARSGDAVPQGQMAGATAGAAGHWYAARGASGGREYTGSDDAVSRPLQGLLAGEL